MNAVVEEEGEDAIEAFDRVIAETLVRLTGRFHTLLSQPALHCLEA